MKALMIVSLLFSLAAKSDTETGRTPVRPATGTKSDLPEKTGEDPRAPDRRSEVKQKQETDSQTGPYKNGEYRFFNPDDRQDQQ